MLKSRTVPYFKADTCLSVKWKFL